MATASTNLLLSDKQSPASPKQHLAIAFLLVVLASVLPYLASLRYGFVYDDDRQVMQNPAIQAWHFFPSYFARPTMATAHYYRPLFLLWLKLNYSLWALKPWGWHLTNIALHTLVSLMVFLLLRQYFRETWFAAAGALPFAVHPVHVETVAWISGCTDTLMAIGLLGSLYFWMRSPNGVRSLYGLISLVFFALALLAKETAAILPLFIFSHSLAAVPSTQPMPETKGSLAPRLLTALWQSMPYWGLTALYLLARSLALRHLAPIPEWIYRSHALLTIPELLLFYLQHLLHPVNLSPLYDLPVVSSPASLCFWVPLALFLALLVVACALYGRLRDRRIALAVLWFVLPLAPVLYIRTFQRDDWAHDRYLYLPLLGLSILVGIVAEHLFGSRWGKILRSPAVATFCLLIIFLGVVSSLEAQPWQSNLALYANALRIAPKNTIAMNNLAGQYIEIGRLPEAAQLLQSTLAARPDMWLANYNFAFLNYRVGRLSVAEDYFTRAIRVDPTDPDEHVYLGLTYFKQGRLQEAADQVRQGITRKPDGVGYHVALGIIEQQQGNLASAKNDILAELAYYPDSVFARTQLQAIQAQLAAAAASH